MKSIAFGLAAALCTLIGLLGLALMWLALVAIAIELWPVVRYTLVFVLGAVMIAGALYFWPLGRGAR